MEDDFPEFAAVLREACSNGSRINHRAMARNILCDFHRTPPERMRAFLKQGGPLLSIDDIQAALVRYRWSHVCPPKETNLSPVYARPENVTNKIDADAMSDNAMVATVLNLTWLGEIYSEAEKRFKIPEFQHFELGNPRDPDEVNQKLGSELSDPNRREAFLAAILKARNRFERENRKYIRITWAAEWNSVEKFLHPPSSPRRWIQAVGVPTETPVWIAVLRYPIRRVEKQLTLYRPTQLDAGWYPHHFPSPPQADVSLGGYSMFLGQHGDVHKDYGLVREFIHEPVDFLLEDWWGAGELLAFVPDPVSGDLLSQRERHLDLLAGEHSDRVREWMPNVF